MLIKLSKYTTFIKGGPNRKVKEMSQGTICIQELTSYRC